MDKKIIRFLADIVDTIDLDGLYRYLMNNGWKQTDIIEADNVTIKTMIKDDCRIGLVTDKNNPLYAKSIIATITTICLVDRIGYDTLLGKIKELQ